MTTIEVGNWINTTITRIMGETEFPSIEVYALAAHITGVPKEKLVSHPEIKLTDCQLSELENATSRLLSGEPLAYILGHWSFFGLDLMISPEVLIPRPETEILVAEGIKWLRLNPTMRNVVDIGTGSGAIAISIGKYVSDAHIIAIDKSKKAISVAEKNIQHHQMESTITLVHNDLLFGMKEKFNLILANLPYIPESDIEEIMISSYEPRMALDGGVDGRRLIDQLLDQAPRHLLPGGCIFLEIQYNQAREVQNKALEVFPGAQVAVIEDLTGHPRVVQIQI